MAGSSAWVVGDEEARDSNALDAEIGDFIPSPRGQTKEKFRFPFLLLVSHVYFLLSPLARYFQLIFRYVSGLRPNAGRPVN